jgi:hypothetical protein
MLGLRFAHVAVMLVVVVKTVLVSFHNVKSIKPVVSQHIPGQPERAAVVSINEDTGVGVPRRHTPTGKAPSANSTRSDTITGKAQSANSTRSDTIAGNAPSANSTRSDTLTGKGPSANSTRRSTRITTQRTATEFSVSPTTQEIGMKPDWTKLIPQWLHNRNTTSVKLLRTGAPDMPSGAFVHIGKTGGSTLSLHLRNGCHSFIKQPCNQLSLNEVESHVSRLTTYYHVPDFANLRRTRHHLFYVLSIRDPLARLLSVFTYMHPENIMARGACQWNICETESIWKCFPNLDEFAKALNLYREESKGQEAVAERRCVQGAQSFIRSSDNAPDHFRHSLEAIVEEYMPPNAIMNSTILVVRNEHIWDDWISVNQWLGQEGKVDAFPDNNVRDFSHMTLPVSKNFSEESRKSLCAGLRDEYRIYMTILSKAANIGPVEMAQSIDLAHRNCPSLQFSSFV